MKVAVMDERLAVRWEHLMVVLMAATMAVMRDVHGADQKVASTDALKAASWGTM